VALPLGVEVDRVARECGAATLAFLRGTGWGKRELAFWLIGRYEPLASYVQAGDDGAPSAGALGPPSESDLSRLPALVRHARRQTLKLLRTALLHGEHLDFAVAAVGHGHVAPAEDTLGRQGWVPVARPRMSLVDRVGSLVTAQRLTRPGEFGADWGALGELLEEIEVDELWSASA
jgi:hypothetical protein